MWWVEWKKFWKNKIFVCLIVVGILANGFLFWQYGKQYDEDKRCFPKDIHMVYQELENVREEERHSYLLQELQKAEMVDETASYHRRGALNTVLMHWQETSEYAEYLEEIQHKAKQISNSALFANVSEFSKRNAEKIPARYNHLYGIHPKSADYTGLVLATEYKMTDALAVMLIVVLSFFFITMEREEGTLSFVRCTRYGGRSLGLQKILVILSGSAGGILLLYLENFVIAGCMFGYHNMNGWIQAINGFLASSWKIKVLDYVVLFLIGKMLAVLVIAAMIVWICIRGKNILETSIILIGIILVEYGLYVGIASNSWLSILKWCNLFSFMRTEKFFQTYETVNFFNYPVSSLLCCIIVGTSLLLLFLYGSISAYEKVSREEYGKKKKRKDRQRRTKGHNIFRYELRKIFIINGAGIIVVLFLAGQIYQVVNNKVYFTLDELYYKNYLKELSGSMTQEKMDWIQEEDTRLKNLEKENPTPEIEKQLLCRTAFEQVKEQVKRIGEDGIFLDEIGFMYLLDKQSFLLRIGEILCVTLLGFFQIFIMEKVSGMDMLWSTLPDGRRKSSFQKWGIIFGTLFLICMVSEGRFLWQVMHSQNIQDFSAPIRYLAGYEYAGNLTIEMYLILRGIVVFFASVSAVGVIAKVSKNVKNAVTVLLVAGGIVGAAYMGVVLIFYPI